MKAKNIFINMSVNDLNKSMDFFKNLGFEFNPQFTSEKGACLVIADNIFVMLLTKEFFGTFTEKAINDSFTSTEKIMFIDFESKEIVNTLVEIAVRNGAKELREPSDYGWMYYRTFQDLDGHNWEFGWSDPSKFEESNN